MTEPNVILIDHPVIQTKLTELRDYTADHRKFRALLDEIAGLMVYEVTRDWPTKPQGGADAAGEDRRESAGAASHAGADPAPGWGWPMACCKLLPDARMGHLGVIAIDETLEPMTYYQKLPPDIAETEVLLIDPMLATGGSGSAAVSFLKKAGVRACGSCVSSPPPKASPHCMPASGSPDLLRSH